MAFLAPQQAPWTAGEGSANDHRQHGQIHRPGTITGEGKQTDHGKRNDHREKREPTKKGKAMPHVLIDEKKKKVSGRPRAMTSEKVGKALEGFSKGLNTKEAALYADVSASVLYDYIKANQDFAAKVDLLQRRPVMRAKINLSDEIDSHSVDVSKWYLERRARDEFGLKAEVSAAVSVGPLEDKEEALKDFMRGLLDL